MNFISIIFSFKFMDASRHIVNLKPSILDYLWCCYSLQIKSLPSGFTFKHKNEIRYDAYCLWIWVENSRYYVPLAFGKPCRECVLCSVDLHWGTTISISGERLTSRKVFIYSMYEEEMGTFLYRLMRLRSSNGREPESISKRITPQDQISAAAPSYPLLVRSCFMQKAVSSVYH